MMNIRTAAGAVVVAAAAVTLTASPASADHGGLHCDEIADVNIVPGHPNWDPALDNDNDGVACEDSSQPNWTPPVTDTAPPVTEPPAPAPTDPAPVAEEPAPAEAPPAAPVVEEPDYTG